MTEKFTGKLTLKQAESIAPIGALFVQYISCVIIKCGGFVALQWLHMMQ